MIRVSCVCLVLSTDCTLGSQLGSERLISFNWASCLTISCPCQWVFFLCRRQRDKVEKFSVHASHFSSKNFSTFKTPRVKLDKLSMSIASFRFLVVALLPRSTEINWTATRFRLLSGGEKLTRESREKYLRTFQKTFVYSIFLIQRNENSANEENELTKDLRMIVCALAK